MLLPIAFDTCYTLSLPEGHRFPMEKYDLLATQLLLEGTAQKDDFFCPTRASIESVQIVHFPLYVEKLINLQLDRSEIRKIGFPLSPALIEREFIIAGGTLQGCEMALDTGVAMNIAGGTHHAYAQRGEAFCLLNDQAIAAQNLLNQGLVKKVLIVDLDVHQGNGTASIFFNNPDVFTFSMHGAKNFPFKKEQSDLDLALEDGTSSKEYLTILKKTLPELIDRVKPDFIFYLSGVDVLKTDKLGRLGLSIEGCKERDAFVFELCKEKEIAVQCSMGGGYSKDINIIVEAHSNTYRLAKEIFT